MALKVFLFLLAAFLVVNASVAFNEEESKGLASIINTFIKGIARSSPKQSLGKPKGSGSLSGKRHEFEVRVGDKKDDDSPSEENKDNDKDKDKDKDKNEVTLLGLESTMSNSMIHVTSPAEAPELAPERHPELDCRELCKERCKEHPHSEKGQCSSACQLCCGRCKCVPPGTSGNKEKCGKCYDEQTIIYGYKITCP